MDCCKSCLEALRRKDDGVVVYRTDSGQQAAAVVVSEWAHTPNYHHLGAVSWVGGWIHISNQIATVLRWLLLYLAEVQLGCQDDEGGELQVAEEGVEGVHQDDQRLLHLGTSGWSDHYNCCLDQLLLFLLFRPMLLWPWSSGT